MPYCHTAIRPRGPRRVAGGVRTVSGPARALALGGTARRGRERDGWGVCALRVYGTDYGSAATPSMIAVVRVAEPVYHYRLYYGYGPRTAL